MQKTHYLLGRRHTPFSFWFPPIGVCIFDLEGCLHGADTLYSEFYTVHSKHTRALTFENSCLHGADTLYLLFYFF